MPLTPSDGVAIRLASLAVHIEEFLGDDGHQLDQAAIFSLLSDPDVREYLKRLEGLGLLPVKRELKKGCNQ